MLKVHSDSSQLPKLNVVICDYVHPLDRNMDAGRVDRPRKLCARWDRSWIAERCWQRDRALSVIEFEHTTHGLVLRWIASRERPKTDRTVAAMCLADRPASSIWSWGAPWSMYLSGRTMGRHCEIATRKLSLSTVDNESSHTADAWRL